MDIVEIPIDTVYLEGNASSHFRPIVDSARVYRPLVAFAASSLTAFAVDAVALFVLAALTHNLLLSVVGARVTSSTVNYLTNSRFVFRSRHPQGRMAAEAGQAPRYFALVAALLCLNYLLLRALHDGLGLPLAAAKLATEIALFVASFQVQRRMVFCPADPTRRDSESPDAASSSVLVDAAASSSAP